MHGSSCAGEAIALPLTKGYSAQISPEDHGLANFKWQTHIDKTGRAYARRAVCEAGKPRNVWLHREITNCPPGMVVDHMNGDSLDNRRENLRVVTQSENMRNIGTQQRPGLSGIRGVYLDKARGKWRATIRIDGRNKSFGLYKTKEEAHVRRLALELEHYGIHPRRADVFREAGLS